MVIFSLLPIGINSQHSVAARFCMCNSFRSSLNVSIWAKLELKRVAKCDYREYLMAVSKSHEAGIFVQHTNFTSIEDQPDSVQNSQWAYVNLHSIGSPDLTDDGKGNRGFRDVVCLNGMMKIVRDVKRGGGCPEHDCNNNNNSKEGRLISRRRPWDSCVNTQHSSFRSPRTSPPSRPPSRVTGGHGMCTCSVSSSPSKPQYCSSSPPPVESCLPGLHQKYHDFYPDCEEVHLPECYRRIVEHDDLYLPPSRPLSPALTDHDDLYLPLSRPCFPPFPRPAKEESYSSSATVCSRPPAVICSCPKLNPPSPPSAFYRDVYLPDTRPCTPKAEYPCPCPSPPQECFDLAGLTTVYDNIPVPPCRKKPLADPYLSKPRDSACSTSPSRSPSPCCEPPAIMSRPKVQFQSRVCQECHSPCCKGPSYCNPQYIVETPFSMSPQQSKVPSPRSRNQGGGGCGGGGGGCDLVSPRCQACDCHKEGGQNCNSFQSAPSCPPPSAAPYPPPKISRPCYSSPPSPCPPSPSPCAPPPPPPCPPSPCGPPPSRLLLAAEMLSAVEECAKSPSPKCAALFSHVPCPKPSSRPASPRPASPPSTCPPKVDFCKTPPTPSPKPKFCNTNTECANCDCHKPAAKSPTPRSCGCPVPAWKLNQPPPSPPRKVESPRSSSPKTAEPKCDCHVTKKHKQLKFSNQIKSPSLCPSPECEDCDCNRYQRKKIQDFPSSKTTPTKQRPPYSPLSPRLLSTDDGTEAEYVPIRFKSPGKSPKQESSIPRLRNAESRRAFEYSKSPDRGNPLYSSEDQPISKAPPQRKKSSPPRPYSKRLPPSRVPRPSYTQGITRRCCCGSCECLDSSSMISTKCPFCSHVHSCCCGMCNCPIPTCSSKSPISDSSTPTPRSPQTSRLPFRSNSEFYSSSRLKSPPPLSARSYFNNRPAKPGPQFKSKSRLELLDPVHHPSPRSQIELFNKFLKSQSSRYAKSPPDMCSAQKEFLPRRSQAPESARTWRSYKQQHQQHHHQGRTSHVPKGTSAILLPTKPSNVKVCSAKTSQPSAYENLRSMHETRLLSQSSLGRRGGCSCRSCACGETPL